MAFARTVAKSLQLFGRPEEIGALTPEVIERLREPQTLLPVAKDVLNLDDEEYGYIEAIPQSVREGMRASLIDAVDQGKRIQISFKPGGSDHIVSMYEYDDAFVLMVEGPC